MSLHGFHRKRKRGIALISVLLILVIMFIISTGFIQMISRDAQIGMGQYQSNLSMMLADSGIEYGLFMIRHNCFIRTSLDPSSTLNEPYPYSNIVISQLTYPSSTGTTIDDAHWLKAQGRFKLYLMSSTSTTVTLRSVGEITRSNGDVLHRRTAYAVVDTGTAGVENTGTLKVTTWFEKWR